MKRKVLIAITQSNFGGAQRYVLDLARSLVTRDFDVVVVCGGAGRLVSTLKDSHIRVITLPTLYRHISLLDEVRVFFSLVAILRRERPDVLHLNSSKIGGIGALAGKVAHTRRIIFTSHGWEFNAPRPQWQKWLIRFFSSLTVLLSDKTIAVSSATKRDLKVLQSKIVVIHNGLDDIAFIDRSTARSTITKHASSLIDPNGLWYLTIAELHPVKGLDNAIKAFQKIAQSTPNAHYIVIGDGYERERLAECIHTCGLDGRVHLVGFIPQAAQYLKAADVFILPSRSEGLAYVVLEAGLASLPLIASKVGGIPEIITSPDCGYLIEAENVSEISKAMFALANDTGLRERLGHALHRRIKEYFSLSRMVDETITTYQ